MITLSEIKENLEKNDRFWICFVGSSTTSCEWVHPNWREITEYVLKQELIKLLGDENWKIPSWGIRCFNFGYDGATTKNILDRLPDVLVVKPNLVMGMAGGNDPLFNITLDKHIENVSKIIQNVLDSGAKIVWATPQRAGIGSHKIEQMKPYARAVVERFHDSENLQIIDMYSRIAEFPIDKFFTFRSEAIPLENIKEGDPDLIHPNQLGNAYIAKVFLEKVFEIKFDPEKYITTTLAGEKYPRY